MKYCINVRVCVCMYVDYVCTSKYVFMYPCFPSKCGERVRTADVAFHAINPT